MCPTLWRCRKGRISPTDVLNGHRLHTIRRVLESLLACLLDAVNGAGASPLIMAFTEGGPKRGSGRKDTNGVGVEGLIHRVPQQIGLGKGVLGTFDPTVKGAYVGREVVLDPIDEGLSSPGIVSPPKRADHGFGSFTSFFGFLDTKVAGGHPGDHADVAG